MARFEDVVLSVDGQELSSWTSYRIDSDLLTPADAFMFEVVGPMRPRNASEVEQRRALVALTAPGTMVEVKIGESLQMKGRISAREVNCDAEHGFSVSVRGYDMAKHLVDSSVDLSLVVQRRRMTRARSVVERVPVTVNPTNLNLEADGFFTEVRNQTPALVSADVVSGATRREDPPTVTTMDGGVTLFAYNPRRTAFDVSPIGRDLTVAQVAGEHAPLIIGRPQTSHVYTYRTVPPREIREDVTFIELCRAAVEAWAIEVVAETNAARSVRTGANLQRGVSIGASESPFPTVRTAAEVEDIRVQEAKPRPGESVWSFLDRHARRLGIMMWMSPDGKLMLSEPNYNTGPLYTFVRRYQNDNQQPNNISRGGRITDWESRYGSVKVIGRGGGNDAARARIKAVTIDPEFPFVKELVVHDPTIRTTADATRRGARELSGRAMDSDRLEFEVPGHGQTTNGRPGDFLFSVDTTARVIDEVTGANGDWYLYGRSFVRDAAGTRTIVRLMPLGALVL